MSAKLKEYKPFAAYDHNNLCKQNREDILDWVLYTEKNAKEIKEKDPNINVFCIGKDECILSNNKPVKPIKLYFPPKLRRCQESEEEKVNYTICCPSDEFDLLMLQGFWEKKKESWKLEEFKDYYISLTKTERQELTQEIIKQEEMYSLVTRDFKIISQEEYNHLKMNWEIKEQTTIFIFLFLTLLVFLKSFRKHFLKKG